MREGSAPGIAFLLPNSEFLIRWATPNRETNGGMRRCQRLPDVTHPVDSTRPASLHIKSRASPRGKKHQQIAGDVRSNSVRRPRLETRMTSRRNIVLVTVTSMADG